METLRIKKNARDQKHYNRKKNAFDGFINRLAMTEKRISGFEDMSTELPKLKKKKKREKRMKKSEQKIPKLWDNKSRNMHIVGIPEKEEKEKEAEEISEATTNMRCLMM